MHVKHVLELETQNVLVAKTIDSLMEKHVKNNALMEPLVMKKKDNVLNAIPLVQLVMESLMINAHHVQEVDSLNPQNVLKNVQLAIMETKLTTNVKIVMTHVKPVLVLQIIIVKHAKLDSI